MAENVRQSIEMGIQFFFCFGKWDYKFFNQNFYILLGSKQIFLFKALIIHSCVERVHQSPLTNTPCIFTKKKNTPCIHHDLKIQKNLTIS